MARIVQAVNKYGPRLEFGPTAQLDEIAAWIVSRTGANKSEVMAMIQELSEMILAFTVRGIPVKLPGVGIFSPSIDRHGRFKINVRIDMALKQGSNAPDAYKGKIRNKEHIGLDNAGYKGLWDVNHPDDLLII